jgi:hypothetical protein
MRHNVICISRQDGAGAREIALEVTERCELPTHYDLVINTDRLPAAHAARLIVGARANAGAGAIVRA